MANYEHQHSDNLQTLQSMAENDRRVLMRLRHMILQLNGIIESHCSGNARVEDAKSTFLKIAERIERDFETLEADAMKMTNASLNTPEMNRLHTLLLGAACDPFQSEVYNKALKISNAGPAILSYVDLAYEFMRNYVGTPATRAQRKDHTSIPAENLFANQRSVEQFLKAHITGLGNTSKRLKAGVRLLEQNPLHCVMEICLYFANEKGGQLLHCKMAALINHGLIENLLVIGPSEEWSYLPENNKIFDFSVKSKFEFYRRYNLSLNVSTPMEPRAFLGLVHCMFRAPNFVQQCGHCKKYLHNFMPAYADCRDKRFSPFHESCR